MTKNRQGTGSDRPLILVADDDPDLRELVQICLEGEGYEVVSAADGEEAYEIALQRSPDLAIVDVSMPRVDGLELTRRLRGHERTRGLPVLLLTALAGDRNVAQGYAAGADDYITKPFTITELTESVRRRRAEREIARSEETLRTLSLNAPVGIFRVDDGGRALFANDRSRDIARIEVGVRVEEAWAAALHPEDRDRVLEAWRRSALQDSELAIEFRFQPAGEPTRFVACNAVAATDSQGRPVGRIATVVDVTERRRSEAQEAALRRVATAVARGDDQGGVFSLIAREAADLLGAHAGRVTRFEPPDLGVVEGSWRASHLEQVGRGMVVRLEDSMVIKRVRATGRPAWLHDRNELRLGAPVVVDGRLWGAVAVIVEALEESCEDAVERLAVFADLVSVTAANADARARLAMQAAEQAALRRVAVAVAEEPDAAAVFPLVAEEAARLLRAEGGWVSRVDAMGRPSRVAEWWAEGSDRFGLLADDPAAAEVRRTRRPARVEAPAADGGRTSVAAPVQVAGRLWGTVGAIGAKGAGVPAGAEERLGRFAELVALAITTADARAQLATLASTDHLTGLANQRTFHERLATEVERARRHDRPLGLVILDLDHFKLVNDTHGHPVGDRVLAETARRLSALARAGEVVARVGGEEFAWILPESDGMDAFAAAERARRTITESPFPGVGRMTVSAGVCDLTEAGDANDLFRSADVALYWAKSSGRNATFRYTAQAAAMLPAEVDERKLERAQALAGIRALARAVDAKDASTQRHSERVAELAERLALARGWSPVRAALLRDAALVHDVGKIGVPDRILLKSGELTAEEYEQVKEHAELGAIMVADVLTAEQTEWVRAHHERMDGSGYPRGLKGVEIPDGARLLALADAWDAMTIARPYGVPRPLPEALEVCRRLAGTQFCPDAVAALESLWASGALAPPRPEPGTPVT